MACRCVLLAWPVGSPDVAQQCALLLVLHDHGDHHRLRHLRHARHLDRQVRSDAHPQGHRQPLQLARQGHQQVLILARQDHRQLLGLPRLGCE